MILKQINKKIKTILNLKIFRISVSVVLLLLIIGAMINFMLIKKISFTDWLMINSCLSIAFPIFIVGYLFKNKIIMIVGCVFMFRYAILGGLPGIFNYGWTSNTVIENIDKILDIIIIATIFHIIMLIITIAVIVKTIKEKRFKELLIGLTIGVLLLIPLMIYQQMWFDRNPDTIEKLLINKNF